MSNTHSLVTYPVLSFSWRRAGVVCTPIQNRFVTFEHPWLWRENSTANGLKFSSFKSRQTMYQGLRLGLGRIAWGRGKRSLLVLEVTQLPAASRPRPRGAALLMLTCKVAAATQHVQQLRYYYVRRSIRDGTHFRYGCCTYISQIVWWSCKTVWWPEQKQHTYCNCSKINCTHQQRALGIASTEESILVV